MRNQNSPPGGDAPSREAIEDAQAMYSEVERDAGLGSLGPEGPDLSDYEQEQIIGTMMRMRQELDELQAWRRRLVRRLSFAVAVIIVLAWCAGIWWAGQ